MDIDSLSPSQKNALDQLQALTNGGDPDVAIGVLSSVDWDVQVCNAVFQVSQNDLAGNLCFPSLVRQYSCRAGAQRCLCFAFSKQLIPRCLYLTCLEASEIHCSSLC